MTNPRMQNTDHLRTVAYKDAAKLGARIEFWKHYGTPRDEWSQNFFDLLEAPDNADILELGCGPAHLWEWGLENNRIPTGWSIKLTDLSPGMLDEAWQNVAGPSGKQEKRFSFETADVCDLPYDDASFDNVIANYMLYHAASQRTAISEIFRVLKPGGRLFAATNSTNHITELLELQEQHSIDPAERGNSGLAHAAFTLENGEEMLRKQFGKVEIIHDKSIARATDPEIVIGFLKSMDMQLDEQKLEATVRAHIARHGHFAVTRSSGALIAQK